MRSRSTCPEQMLRVDIFFCESLSLFRWKCYCADIRQPLEVIRRQNLATASRIPPVSRYSSSNLQIASVSRQQLVLVFYAHID